MRQSTYVSSCVTSTTTTTTYMHRHVSFIVHHTLNLQQDKTYKAEAKKELQILIFVVLSFSSCSFLWRLVLYFNIHFQPPQGKNPNVILHVTSVS